MPSWCRLFLHWTFAAASRTFWTAGSSRPMRIAMIAITTSSSISVNADRRELVNMTRPSKKRKERNKETFRARRSLHDAGHGRDDARQSGVPSGAGELQVVRPVNGPGLDLDTEVRGFGLVVLHGDERFGGRRAGVVKVHRF